jgi:hypothetical protein
MAGRLIDDNRHLRTAGETREITTLTQRVNKQLSDFGLRPDGRYLGLIKIKSRHGESVASTPTSTPAEPNPRAGDPPSIVLERITPNASASSAKSWKNAIQGRPAATARWHAGPCHARGRHLGDSACQGGIHPTSVTVQACADAFPILRVLSSHYLSTCPWLISLVVALILLHGAPGMTLLPCAYAAWLRVQHRRTRFRGDVRSGVGRCPVLDEFSQRPAVRFKIRSVQISLFSQPFSPTQPRFTAVQSNSASFHSLSVQAPK